MDHAGSRMLHVRSARTAVCRRTPLVGYRGARLTGALHRGTPQRIKRVVHVASAAVRRGGERPSLGIRLGECAHRQLGRQRAASRLCAGAHAEEPEQPERMYVVVVRHERLQQRVEQLERRDVRQRTAVASEHRTHRGGQRRMCAEQRGPRRGRDRRAVPCQRAQRVADRWCVAPAQALEDRMQLSRVRRHRRLCGARGDRRTVSRMPQRCIVRRGGRREAQHLEQGVVAPLAAERGGHALEMHHGHRAHVLLRKREQLAGDQQGVAAAQGDVRLGGESQQGECSCAKRRRSLGARLLEGGKGSGIRVCQRMLEHGEGIRSLGRRKHAAQRVEQHARVARMRLRGINAHGERVVQCAGRARRVDSMPFMAGRRFGRTRRRS